MSFKNEMELAEIVRKFEDASIDRDAWKHAEHLVVALCYVKRYGLDDGLVKMRDGLFGLLTRGFHVDLTKEMPYHETMTVFWMRAVDDFLASKNGASTVEIANEMIERFDKDYPLKFYTREVLFSDEARTKFVEGDIKQE